MYILSFLKPPPTTHTVLLLWVVTEPWLELSESYSKYPLAIYFTYCSVYVSMLLSPFIAPFLPSHTCPQACSLYLCFHCCSANRFISTIFLDFIYMYQSMIFVVQFLTISLLKGSCWITQRRHGSWPPEETNSIQGQRQGWVTQSFCVIKFY